MKIGFGAIGIKKGEPGSLDYIDVDSFRQDDICLVVENNKMYFYTLEQYSGANENIPFIVKPKGADEGQFLTRLKRWNLISQKNFTTDIIQVLGKSLQTQRLRALGNLKIESASGMEIDVNADGTVTFPLFMSGINPVENNQASTKQYFMVELTLMDTTIRDYLDLAIDDFDAISRVDTIQYIDDSALTLYNNIANLFDFDPSIIKQVKQWEYDGNQVTHNLDTKDLIVQIYNEDDEKIIPDELRILDNNTLEVYPITGNVVIRKGEEGEGDITNYWIDDEKVYFGDDMPEDYVSITKDVESEETFDISDTWEFRHGLLNKNVLISVYDEFGEKIKPDTIKLMDYNTILLEFDEPVAGRVVVAQSEYEYGFEEDLNNLQISIETYLESNINTWNDEIRDNVISYIDYKIEELENYDWIEHRTKKFVINEWNAVDGMYYTEIVHGLDIDRYLMEFYVNGSVCNPVKVERSDNILKIWNSVNDEMIIVLNYMNIYGWT